MKQKGKNIALLLAGGKGLRVHETLPKQYVEVEGRTVLGHTLRAFALTPGVDRVYVVCAPEWARLTAQIGRRECGSRWGGTIDGGETSVDSLRSGVETLASLRGRGPADVVLVHDAVRPLVSPAIIGEAIRVCREKGNAVAAAVSRETFLHTNGRLPVRVLSRRDSCRLAQTPVAFTLGALCDLFEAAREQGLATSESLVTLCDDLGVLPLHASLGHWTNFKITDDEDLAVLRQLLRGRSAAPAPDTPSASLTDKPQ